MLDQEADRGALSVVNVVDQQMLAVSDPADMRFLGAGRGDEIRSFAFDRVFSEESSQDEVFSETCTSLIDTVMRGINATIFAYGATGSGKTFTMFGSDFTDGIVAQSFQSLYETIQTMKGHSAQIDITFIEIYNEVIRDLLTAQKAPLDLREDPERGPCVAGVRSFRPTSFSQLVTVLQEGNRRRMQEATKANQTSSRSHAIIQVEVKNANFGSTRSSRFFSKFSLVDLAGSERASASDNRGIRLREGAKINCSLLALGNVINAIVANPNGHIPYRDSKLTRLLKDSLGGRCRTSILATISPCHTQYHETLNTLVYADRAKKIRVNPQQNIVRVENKVFEYQSIIENLNSQVEDLKQQLHEERSQHALRVPPLDQATSDNPATQQFLEEFKSRLVESFSQRTELKQRLVQTENDYQLVMQEYSSYPPQKAPAEYITEIKRLESMISQLNREITRCGKRVSDIKSYYEEVVDPRQADRFLDILGYNEALKVHNAELEAQNLMLVSELSQFVSRGPSITEYFPISASQYTEPESGAAGDCRGKPSLQPVRAPPKRSQAAPPRILPPVRAPAAAPPRAPAPAARPRQSPPQLQPVSSVPTQSSVLKNSGEKSPPTIAGVRPVLAPSLRQKLLNDFVV